MGPVRLYRLILSAAPLLLAATAPASAQSGNSADPVVNLPLVGAPQSTGSGPIPNVGIAGSNRTVVAAPPITVPTLPLKVPTGGATQARPTLNTPIRTMPDQSRPEPRPSLTPIEEIAPDPAAPVEAAPADNNAQSNAAAPTQPEAAAQLERGPRADQAYWPMTANRLWPWIAAALALFALLLGFALLRRRRRAADEADDADEYMVEQDSEPVPPPPASESVTQSSPEPLAVAPAPDPAPADSPATDSPRPWLEMGLRIESARYAMMGVTIAYVLTLHNRGTLAAQDILVRAIIGNAGAQQQALLEGFFGETIGTAVHSLVTIAPGETLQLHNELRLPTDQVVPVQTGNQLLLVPLMGLDVRYQWLSDDDAAQADGRTARAYILGQEQEPPAERLAPFRLDQGPRQYRRAAVRAAGELTPS